jgi:hypothetical protein
MQERLLQERLGKQGLCKQKPCKQDTDAADTELNHTFEPKLLSQSCCGKPGSSGDRSGSQRNSPVFAGHFTTSL